MFPVKAHTVSYPQRHGDSPFMTVQFESRIPPFKPHEMSAPSEAKINEQIWMELDSRKLDIGWNVEAGKAGPRPSEECQRYLEYAYRYGVSKEDPSSHDLARIYSAYVVVRGLGDSLKRGYEEVKNGPTKRPRVGIEQRLHILTEEVRIWDRFYRPKRQKMQQVFEHLWVPSTIAFGIKFEIHNCIGGLTEPRARQVASVLFQPEERLADHLFLTFSRWGVRQIRR